MANNKKSFLIYKDTLDVLEELTDEQAGKLFKAIKCFQTDQEIELDMITKLVMLPFKQQFERDSEKYENTVERNKINGSKGGRPKNPKEPKKPSGLNGLLKEPKKPDTDTDTDTDTVTDKVNDKQKGKVLTKWLNYRKEIKKPIKIESTLNSLLKKFNENSLQDLKIAVDKSIENGYTGLFLEAENKNKKSSDKKEKDTRSDFAHVNMTQDF